MSARVVNALWLAAIVGCALSGWVPGLLGIVAFFLMDLLLEVKAIRVSAETVAAVFETEPDEMTEERAEELTADVMARVKREMQTQAVRRPH